MGYRYPTCHFFPNHIHFIYHEKGRIDHRFMKLKSRKLRSIIITPLWALLTIVWGVIKSHGWKATLADGVAPGSGRQVRNMQKCHASRNTLSQSSWRECDRPIELQSPDFVVEAYDTTGRASASIATIRPRQRYPASSDRSTLP
jgi:hypothetical protein